MQQTITNKSDSNDAEAVTKCCNKVCLKHWAVFWLYYINLGLFFAATVPLALNGGGPIRPSPSNLSLRGFDDSFIFILGTGNVWQNNLQVSRCASAYCESVKNEPPGVRCASGGIRYDDLISVQEECSMDRIIPTQWQPFYGSNQNFTYTYDTNSGADMLLYNVNFGLPGYFIRIFAIAVFGCVCFKETIKCLFFASFYCIRSCRNSRHIGCVARNGWMICCLILYRNQFMKYLYAVEHNFANGKARFIILDALFQDLPQFILTLFILLGTATSLSFYSAAISLASFIFSAISVVHECYVILGYCCSSMKSVQFEIPVEVDKKPLTNNATINDNNDHNLSRITIADSSNKVVVQTSVVDELAEVDRLIELQQRKLELLNKQRETITANNVQE